MESTQPKDEQGRFTSPYPEPLATEPLCVRVPKSIDELVRSLPKAERTAWLRQKIVAAAERELTQS